jgi:DNA repair protein RecN (Recombination protein N)
MLERVAIRDFSLLRQVDLALGPGLTVITGESGAGKTLLFDAIAFALGGKPHRSLLAEGAKSCEVALHLRLDAPQALAAGPPWQAGPNVLARKLSASGRGQLSLNGQHLTLVQAPPVLENWFEITGQFESRILFNTKAHLKLLDAFGDSKLAAQYATYREQYRRLRELQAKLAALRESAANRAQEIDFLNFQVQELTQAAVAAGERRDVEARLRLLQNAGQLILAAEAAAVLLGGGEDQEGAYDLAARAAQQVAELVRLLGGGPSPAGDPVELAAQTEDVLEGLRELAGRCHSVAAGIQHDPQEMQRQNERLDDLLRLERKYGCTADELPGLLEAKQSRLALLNDPGMSQELLEADACAALDATLAAGRSLSVLRKAAAEKLVRTSAKQFKQLDFQHVAMYADVSSGDEPGPDGLDSAELLITLNPGEPARPLALVASGGEASRLMLGLKAALAGQLGYRVLLLDEVEAGLGADTAAHVAKVLAELAAGRQVLAITHLPVVAAAGREHLCVAKSTVEGRSAVAITAVTGAQRRQELVRMLGGGGDTETAALAERMLGK